MKIRVMSAALVLAAALPAMGAAQGRVEVSPYLGMYISIGSLIDEGGGPSQSGTVPTLRKRQVGTGLAGLRLLLRANTRLGMEALMGFSPSMVAITDARSTTDHNGPVLLGGARLLLALTKPGAQLWNFHVTAGPGFVHRTGATWASTLGTTDLAAMLGLGTTLRSSERLSFRLELEDFVSSAAFYTRSHGATTARLHHDLIWSVGGVFHLGNR